MIDVSMISTQMWWLLAGVMLPVAVLSGYYLWVLDRRERALRLRLETFRGSIGQTLATYLPWYHQFGIWLEPVIGVVEQQRLQKALNAAGIKASGSVATFITIKMLTALVLAGLLWLAIEMRHVFEAMMIF